MASGGYLNVSVKAAWNLTHATPSIKRSYDRQARFFCTIKGTMR